MRMGLVILSFFALSIAQNPVQESTLRMDRPLAVTVDRVNVLFTVASERGKLLTNLPQDHFTVFEDDQPQRITNFASETDLPLNIALLLDSSGSIRESLRFEKEAAASFFYSVLHPHQDRALVMTFDTAVRLQQDYTDNASVLAQSVDKVISGGSTSLYDAICEAATHKLAGQMGRRVIVIVSDGMDNSSHTSLEKTLEVAQKNDVIIYAISTNRLQDPVLPEREAGDRNLTLLAGQTGGRVLTPAKIQELNHAFQYISKELRSQYSLAYEPTNNRRDGTYRQIRVVPSNKTYKVRSRHGYFAPS